MKFVKPPEIKEVSCGGIVGKVITNVTSFKLYEGGVPCCVYYLHTSGPTYKWKVCGQIDDFIDDAAVKRYVIGKMVMRVSEDVVSVAGEVGKTVPIAVTTNVTIGFSEIEPMGASGRAIGPNEVV